MHRVPFAAMMCLATLTALAQDPVQLDPEHFKVELENVQVRVLHIYIGPHERTPTYQQPPSVLVWLTDARLKCTGVDGKTEEVHRRAKQADWNASTQNACENLGNEPVELYQIVLKARRPYPE